MRSKRSLLIILASIVAIFAGLLFTVTQFAQPVAPETGASAHLLTKTFVDTHGQSQALSQWRGQVLIVNFWASWCPPCREEMPELSALHDQYKAHGLTVLGISTDDVAKMQQYAQESPVSYPLVAADLEGMALARQLGNDREALPYTVILRRDGSIAATIVGRINPEALEQEIKPLL